jgi:hypothetical protein
LVGAIERDLIADEITLTAPRPTARSRENMIQARADPEHRRSRKKASPRGTFL